MALSTKLELRQSQQLVMTPQLQQAIRLLQYSNLELTQFVETELERNPLLEREVERSIPGEATDLVDARQPAATDGPDQSLDFSTPGDTATRELDSDATDAFPEAEPGEFNYAAGTNPWSSTPGRSAPMLDDTPNLEEYVAGRETLREHLEHQLGQVVSGPAEELIGRHLID
ncbi:MAG: RNA polymerase sigma-54 factor, partial [Hyphomicrobiaceae bacterium]